jgi:hypothetical protein
VKPETAIWSGSQAAIIVKNGEAAIDALYERLDPEQRAALDAAKPDEAAEPRSSDVPPSIEHVKNLIDRLDRKDREMLRPWVLAHYDVRGYKQKRMHP